MNRKQIHIFYSCDEIFSKYTIVSITSLIKNASKNNQYHIHILNSDITRPTAELFYKLETDNFTITIDDVTA